MEKRIRRGASQKRIKKSSNAEWDWQQTFDGSRDGICLLDSNQKILRCNRTMIEILKKKPEDILGKQCHKVIHGTSGLIADCPVERMKRTLRRESMELEINGRWYDVSVDPILYRGTTLRGIVHSIRDITESIRAREALARSEEKYRTLAESSPEMIYVIGVDGIVQYVNTAATKMFRAEADRVIGKRLDELYSPQVASRHLETVRRVIKTEKPLLSELLERFPGGSRWIDSRLSPIRDEKGAIVGVLGLSEDITQRKRMEEELLRAQKIDALGVMAGGIAHDFNNLLAGVFGFLDLARVSMTPGDPAIGYLDKAFIAFGRAKALSRQLLTFSKGGAPVKKPLTIADILSECCNLSMSGSNVRCFFSIPEDLSVIEADEYQLSQVFSNILINARQAMPEGGSVNIIAENRSLSENHELPLPPGDYVTVSIKDEGIGIPDKIVDRIFDPFFTTKQQGSGLGLAISYSIVKRHGGHIQARSVVGVGTTFTVWLPSSNKPLPSEGPPIAESSLRGTGRILVMDDEPTIREMISYLLQTFGYTVHTASDGQDVIEKYRDALETGNPFDLVLLDLTVPGGMGGEKAIAELRKIDPGVAACVTSGYADSAMLSDPSTYGFLAMIAKPYRANDLLTTVKDALEKKKKT